MRLKTILRKDDFQGRAFVDYIEGSEVDHDAACAHALMLAVKEHHGRDWIEYRADEILAGWGFDSGEDE